MTEDQLSASRIGEILADALEFTDEARQNFSIAFATSPKKNICSTGAKSTDAERAIFRNRKSTVPQSCASFFAFPWA